MKPRQDWLAEVQQMGETPSAKALYYGIFLICCPDSSMYHIVVMYTSSVLLKYWFFHNTKVVPFSNTGHF